MTLFLLKLLHVLLNLQMVMSTIQVELACPALTFPETGGNTALLYHRPAYEEAMRVCNLRYAGVFNFTMTFLPGDDQSRVRTNPEMKDASMDDLSEWYFKRRLDGVSIILSPGKVTFKSLPF
ncbi:hypothetical protein BV898_13370 [Hypsibius exemplaris]|uniref:C-type lectin domain-containing protein n=1 Tax=Hypsibius exemplaris TaxID=2072580 RepID=A0A1W0WAZ4_HYPEX|nr:hypothetical protein BV898_13370 [Hypsibius exemplaris]